jgi:hypothetical protein
MKFKLKIGDHIHSPAYGTGTVSDISGLWIRINWASEHLVWHYTYEETHFWNELVKLCSLN